MSDHRKPEKTWLGMAVSPEFEALTSVEILYSALFRVVLRNRIIVAKKHHYQRRLFSFAVVACYWFLNR
jgi:hypothetical protein